MKVKSLISLFLASTALLFLDSCSRESPLKENVGLQNNHSRVFASREPFKDPQAFIDSMANTPVDTTNIIPDTLTVTVNDSIYLIGILPRFVDKIYLFQWRMVKDSSTVEIEGDNAKEFAWAYSRPGVYYPQFIAIDGNGATDTAGTGTKRMYINVIDTKPELSVPKDTLWTKHDGDVTFGIFAADSFGTIKSVKVNLDANGKEEAKEWKYEAEDDSLFLTIKHDEKYIDSLGNQKIYVIITDDDDNEVKDSINLHYNRLPSLKIISPLDGSRHHIKDRFYFYYESEDADNPQDLRFFIYAQQSTDGYPPKKAFTSDDLIGKDITSSIYEPTMDAQGNITLINQPNTKISSRIFWDMYVTDGYDVVRMERIATSDTSSRPWNFYLGDLSQTQGTFSGVAKYEGRDNHAGIRIQFNNGSKIFDGFTDEKGNYTIKADIGSYEVRASSDTIREYAYAFQYNLLIEAGSYIKVKELLLKDTVPPTLVVKDFDTLSVRKIESMNIYAKDLASRLASVTVKFDDKEQEPTCNSSEGGSIINCGLSIDNLVDGDHILAVTAKDKVGNTTVKKDTIHVRATKLTLDVNGFQKDKIGQNSTKDLVFTANITNAYPDADSVIWNWDIEGKTESKSSKVTEGKATITLTYEDIVKNFKDKDDPAHAQKDFTMSVSYKDNGADVSANVKFGILGEMPSVVFTKPGSETIVTKNDPIDFEVIAYPGEQGTKIETLSWNCGDASKVSSTYGCPATKSDTDNDKATFAYKDTGDYKITVTVTDDHGDTGTDMVTVKVVSDAPSIKVTTKDNNKEYKINSNVAVSISASDKMGTVNKISYGCSYGPTINTSENTVSVTPASVIENLSVTIDIPTYDKDATRRCIFVATDDDDEVGRDTLVLKVLEDKPTVSLKTKRDTVKINSVQKIEATAMDQLGKITKYEIACGDKLNSLPAWTTMDQPKTSVTMPEKATDYYCVVRVTDDDGKTASDTAVYKVLVGRPVVTGSVNYKTVTLNDEVELNAHAVDSLGSIVRYEWGCGSSAASKIIFSYYSQTTPKTTMVMPGTADDKYRCIIRVTDDDNNQAYDTLEIKVILAPPTVKVTQKSLIIREGFNIALNATASDDNNGLPSDPGEIVKREWSCALPNEISNNWKTVTTFDTVWKAPAQNPNFICVARATDNDGNTANDTMTFSFTSETPIIRVTSELIYLNQGDNFSLDAKINSAWQGINWFSWECVDQANGKSMEKSVDKYDYKANGGSFEVGKDSTYSQQGKNMYCIVSAEEKSSREVFKDTTEVRIMKYYPKGVISAADTVYLWSGDEAVPVESQLYYTPQWGGFCSKRGELSPPEAVQGFYWNFSTIDNEFYKGFSDGRIDTSASQVYDAFIRPDEEGSMVIGLAYRDSTTDGAPPSFFLRHGADTVYRTVYFRRAWQNLAADTVFETAISNVPTAFAFVGNKPATAYLSGKNTVKVATYNGTKWNELDSFTAGDSVTSVQLASDGKDLYVGALSTDKKFVVKKSAGGTSPFTTGETTSGVAAPKLISSPAGKIAFSYINTAETNTGYIAYLNGSSWTKKKIIEKNLRDITAVYTSDEKFIAVGIANNNDYTGYVSMLNNSYEFKVSSSNLGNNYGSVGIAVDGKNLYLAYMNRDIDHYGTFLKQATINSSSIDWKSNNQIFEGLLSYHLSVAARNGIVYVANDDFDRATNTQVNVFRYENNTWHYHGENQLPYFGKSFYDRNRYYMRGFAPQLAFDGNGKLHLSMLARTSGSAANTKYNGPIVMKYVAENWNVTPTTCEE